MNDKTKNIIGIVVTCLGIGMVIVPAALPLFGIDPGKAGTVLEIIGALKAALGGMLQHQLGSGS